MSTSQVLAEFSKNILINGEMIHKNLNHFPKINDIYNACKIDLEIFYESCALISYKTSNSQNIVDSWPFWQFNNFMSFLNKILEKENGGEKDENNQEDSTNKSMDEMMGNAKKMMNGVKLPKLPK